MGATFSSSNALHIWCNRPCYAGGESVDGYVLLNVAEATEAVCLNVELIGYESTKWDEMTEARAQTEDARTTCPRQGRRELFKVSAPLFVWEGSQTLQPGQYQYPFQVLLPQNLPGTFKFNEGQPTGGLQTCHNISAEIEYRAQAELVGPAGATASNLRASTELVVWQLPEHKLSELTSEHTATVQACCCNAGDRLTVRLRAGRDAYSVGETAEVVLEVDNRTHLAFVEAKVELERRLHLSAASGSYDEEERLLRIKCAAELHPGASYLGDNAQRLSLALPPGLLPTTCGGLIRCSYVVTVELQAAQAGAFQTMPRLRVPLTIFGSPPPHTRYDVTAPPAFWSPSTIAPPVEIELPGAPPQAPAPAVMIGKGAENPVYGSKH